MAIWRRMPKKRQPPRRRLLEIPSRKSRQVEERGPAPKQTDKIPSGRIEEHKGTSKSRRYSERYPGPESERDALTAEMDKEEILDEKSVTRPDIGIEEIFKLKDTITKLTVENSRLQSLNKEYMRRYNDVLNFGNKIKLENRELQKQIQDLLMKGKAAKAE